MPVPEPSPVNARRFGTVLIAFTCLSSGVALAAGRSLLQQLATPLTPETTTAELQQARHGVDPQRRRQAALLLNARLALSPQQRSRLLRGQGWGPDTLAAVSLKLSALAATEAGHAEQAQALWQQLLHRFPLQAASADALYALGRQQPALRQQLLRNFPAHPAALAAAVDRGDALHLARWGARWPGAEALLRQACQQPVRSRTDQERIWLAQGLAQLGQPQAAQTCLGQSAAPPALQLALSEAMLRGSPSEHRQGLQQLLALARRHPNSQEAREAASLLAEDPQPIALDTLGQLPATLQDSAAVQARLALEGTHPWQAVLRRWPQAPASWELQWQLARRALLQRQWQQASTLLASLNSRQLPAALAARQLFWQGYSAQQRGQTEEAQRLWRALLAVQPLGYYAWRAQQRLQIHPAQPKRTTRSTTQPPPRSELSWHPLNSGDRSLDALWQSGQWLEAWESWRHRRGGQPARTASDLWLEGRLRTAIGDDWTGLGQLEQANLRLPQRDCLQQWQLEADQHPRRFQRALQQAAQTEGVATELLWAIAKQESRFSPAVGSPVGAIGLLQLMPDTASELAGEAQTARDLQNPERNAQLAARYLHQLLLRWREREMVAIASYNAGPGAVANWLSGDGPNPETEPELWVEAIPYPETRLYVKKVLGNLFTYQQLALSSGPSCPGTPQLR